MTGLGEREATGADLETVGALLAAAGLPIDDLHDGGRRFFLYTDPAGVLVGCAGLEGQGPDLLLRSVATVPETRGKGHGTVILALIEQHARSVGCERLWLLTTTADGFFARHGYTIADRIEAPETIRNSRQFAGICPSSATFMQREVPAPR